MFNTITLFAVHAEEAAAAAEATGFQGFIQKYGMTILLIVAMVAVFYFLIIRPQRKRDKEAKDMRDSIRVGDEITTIGGIVGEVCHIKDDNIVIEVGADRVRMEFKKWAIASNESAAAAARKAAEDRRNERAKAKKEK
jgi:preprotein translocase subunit YajC